jgi:thiamine-phosphate pyrophosphorylase
MADSIPCLTYLITDGSSTPKTFHHDSQKILDLIKKAVEQNISMVQIREKNLTARQLFELSEAAVKITKNTSTKLLINDRADIAYASGADGVHLTSHSLPAAVIRQNFPAEFVIGVSTHSLETAMNAKDQGANFITFGPVFPTRSKIIYGEPQGVEKLAEAINGLGGFPIFALGGINESNYRETIDAGVAGVAGISWFYEMLNAE